MKLFEPKLDAKDSILAFDDFVKLYNKDRKLGEHLRHNHRAVMWLLNSFLNKRLTHYNNVAKLSGNLDFSILDPKKPISITTSNKNIAKAIKISTRTVKRLIIRLEEANVFIKVFRGREYNYTIIFNPLLLFIKDLAQKNVFLKPAPNQAFLLPRRTNCPPKYHCYGNISNKIIIHKADSNKFESSQVETNGNKNGNTGKCAISSSRVSDKNPLGINIPTEIAADWEKNIARQNKIHKEVETAEKAEHVQKIDSGKVRFGIIKDELDRKQKSKALTTREKAANAEVEIKKLRVSYAILMVQVMIEHLLPKKFVVHKAYFNEVVEYVTDHYFGNIQTYIGIERAWAGYSTRLEEARKFKKINPNYTPFPRPYFDKTNPKGFDNPEWYKNRLKWGKQKKYQTDQRRLMQSVRAFNENPIKEVYDQQIESLRKTVQSGSTFKAFFKIVANSNGGLLPKFNNPTN